MGLRTKFNMVLILAFVIGLALAGFLSYRIAEDNAREEVILNAQIMMEQATAVRAHIRDDVSPLLRVMMEQTGNFLPLSVPTVPARQIFRDVQESFPAFSYREASLNPTNVVDDLADDYEAAIINQFIDDDNLSEIIAQRDTENGPSLVLARPIRMSAECSSCHSTPDVAPPAMLDLYGDQNGFGWEVGEVIAAQMVTVPMSVPLERARTVFLVIMVALASVFILVLILINLILQFVVIKPVLKIANIAERVSLGDGEVEEYTRTGKDEIASLSTSFNRMRRSLENAMKMLDD